MASRDLPPTGRGYDPWEVASSLQKAVRRSMVREAAYWGFELWQTYEGWAWSRVGTIASEDIGPADRTLPATLAVLEQRSRDARRRGKGGGMEFVHAVILLATAPKSRIACLMVLALDSDHHPRLEVSDESLDQHTRRGLRMGRGGEHFLNEASRLIDFDGDLAEIEAEYREHFARVVAKDETLPQNPWSPRIMPKTPKKGSNPENASKSALSGFGQLRLRGQNEEEDR
jgi:hypothetical protein